MTTHPAIPTRRYAAIEANSGYVWGAVDVEETGTVYDDALIAAARVIAHADASLGIVRPTNFCHVALRDASAMYYMYRIEASCVVEDGTDSETIAAVELSPFVGAVAWCDRTTDNGR